MGASKLMCFGLTYADVGDDCDSAGKDCVVRLLDKDDKTRLGSRSGASEVKQHKWFAKINWGLLRNTRPPVSVLPSGA